MAPGESARLASDREAARRLFTTHYRYLGVWPCIYKSWIISLAAHGVVARAIRVTYDNGYLRHHRVGHSIYQLSTVFNDTGMLAAAAYHKAGNILQEHQWYFLLVAVHDKAGRLVCAVVIDNAAHLHFALAALHYLALVGYYAHCPAIYTRIAANDGLAIVFLKLVEL